MKRLRKLRYRKQPQKLDKPGCGVEGRTGKCSSGNSRINNGRTCRIRRLPVSSIILWLRPMMFIGKA